MTLKFQESFDGVSTYSQFLHGVFDTVDSTHGKWVASGGSTRFTIDASGRTGQCLKHDGTDGGGVVTSQQLGLGTECYVGFGYKPGHLSDMTTDGVAFMQILDEDGAAAASLQKKKNGSIVISTQALTATSAAGVLVTTGWQYVEVHYKMADSGGILEVRVDGVDVVVVSGDTKGASETTIERISLSSGTGGSTNDLRDDAWDDVYAIDTAGSAPQNTWLGNFKCRAYRPNGNGNSSQLVGSDGNSTDNYQLVDEQGADDADYVQSTADGDKDTYAFEDASITGTVVGVQLVAKSRYLNGTDPKGFNGVARLSGTETEVAMNALNATIRERWAIFETKPGGGAWTDTDLDNAEWGVKQIDA